MVARAAGRRPGGGESAAAPAGGRLHPAMLRSVVLDDGGSVASSGSEWTVVSSRRGRRRRRDSFSVSGSSWSTVGSALAHDTATDESSWADVASVASAASAASSFVVSASVRSLARSSAAPARSLAASACSALAPPAEGVWSDGCYLEAVDRPRVASHFDEESRYFGFSGRRVWARLTYRNTEEFSASAEGEVARGDVTAFDLLGRSGPSGAAWERVASKLAGVNPFFVRPSWRLERALGSVAGSPPTVRVRREYERCEFSLPVLGSVVFRQTKAVVRRAKRAFDASRVFELQSAADADSIRVRPVGAYEERGKVLKRVGPGACELPVDKVSAPKGHCKAGRVRDAVGLGAGGAKSFFRPDSGAASRRQCLELDLGRVCVVRAVAMSARVLETSVFPSPEWLRDQGLKKWTGSRYLVPTAREKQIGLATERFFRAVELFFRRDKGEAWVSAGVLRGPSSNFEAHVCDLRGVREATAGGVEARFLRFMPLVEGDWSERGLRVAVFGAQQDRTAKQERAERAERAGESSDKAPATVTYVLGRWRAPGKISTLCSSRAGTGCRCSCCLGWEDGAKGGRRRAAARSISDYLARELGTDEAAWNDYQQDLLSDA